MRRTGDSDAESVGPSLGDYLREQRRAAQLSLRQLAARAEVSNPYLSQVERGLRHPSAQVLTQIARGLQISAGALYVRAGLLDDVADRRDAPAGADPAAPVDGDRPDGPDRGLAGAVAEAVRSDPHLQERHKRLLLEHYAAFRRETAAGAGTTAAGFDAAAPPTAAPHDRVAGLETVPAGGPALIRT